MKLLVFAHVPPPHHGQSYMVQLMLNGFGGDCRKPGTEPAARQPLTASSVTTSTRAFPKASKTSANSRSAKSRLILFYCLQAIWCRFRYGVTNFYYVPAPGKSVALYRDWLVMFICRPFFKQIILHWHAAGLAKWLETSVQIRTRAVTYHAFKHAGLQHRHVQLQCRRRGKTFAAAHSRRQQRHSRSVPGFQQIHFAAAPGAFCRAREIVRERTAQPGRARNGRRRSTSGEGFVSRALHPRERAVRRRAGRRAANQILARAAIDPCE